MARKTALVPALLGEANPPIPAQQPWPADDVQRRPVAALVPYARNARTHSDEQVAQLAGSIRQWGWTMPVLVDEDDGIIAGHGRVLAAHRLGLLEVPVMVARGWSDAQKRAYIIADNKLALNAGWDAALLTLELGDLQSAGFDLGLTGFDPGEVKELFAKAAIKEGLTDADNAPALPEHPITRLGECWQLGQHRLMCGDATDAAVVERCLDGARPHLMVTDPPYGVDYDPAWRARAGVNLNKRKLGSVANDDRADWSAAWALFPGGTAYVWHAAVRAGIVEQSLRGLEFDIRAQIIWAKDRFALSRGDYHWQHEPCWYAVRKGHASHWQGDRSQSTRWDIAAREDGGHGHGTQKPVACMRRPIENSSRAGDGVYEPFSGSGTTIIAAEQTGRIAYAVELDPRYVDVAILRWQEFIGGRATLDGRSFAEVAVERQEESDGTETDPDAAGEVARQAVEGRAAD